MNHPSRPNRVNIEQVNSTIRIRGNEALLAVLSRDATLIVVLVEDVQTSASNLDVV